MPKSPSQSDLIQQLKAARAGGDPNQQRDRALDLLAATFSREAVDLALHTLLHEDVITTLDTTHRPTLHAKAAYYFEQDGKDRGGLIREAILRLLIAIGHPEDRDLYLAGLRVYHRQPVMDSAQNLRAVALSGLFALDRDLACAWAVRLLGEPDTSPLNGQPTITAMQTLLAGNQVLPIYHFVLRLGDAFISKGLGEVVSQALEALGRDLPRPLFEELAEYYANADSPSALSGITSAIVEQRISDLYPLVKRVITSTHHDDLHAYILILLAAARDPALVALLYRLARTCPRERIQHFINAVELTLGDEREDILALLAKRA